MKYIVDLREWISNHMNSFFTDVILPSCPKWNGSIEFTMRLLDQLHPTTRTTFETPKYPRRPRDQYTAQIVNTLELSAPPPNRGKKKQLFNLVISLMKFRTTNTYAAAKMVAVWNSRFVKQSSDFKLAQYLSDVTGSPTVKGGLSLVAVLLITNIHGSVAFPVLLPIDIEHPHHNWNVLYR